MTTDFTAYGLPLELIETIKELNLSKNKILSLRIVDLIEMGFSENQSKFMKNNLKRKPISRGILNLLLENSNSLCCVCKGDKAKTYVIHHIVPYAESQNNEYDNLVVLCSVCHDLAHRHDGLTLGIDSQQLRLQKKEWEARVAHVNSHRAAAQFSITAIGVDYANITRIEEACKALLGKIPKTSGTASLEADGVQFRKDGTMDLNYISTTLSNGRYPFNFPGGGTSSHWIELVEKLGGSSPFHDINSADASGAAELKKLEGKFAFYTGFCQGESVPEPILLHANPIKMSAELENAIIDLAIEPSYLLSSTAISRIRGRNRYAAYFWIRSIEVAPATPKMRISAIPLLLAAPAGFVGLSNTPFIPKNEWERRMKDRETRRGSTTGKTPLR